MESLTSLIAPVIPHVKPAKPSIDESISGPSLLLADCEPGEKLSVVRLLGRSEMQGRLESVGIYPGQVLSIFRAHGRGALVIDSADMRLALDRRLAQMIVVQRNA